MATGPRPTGAATSVEKWKWCLKLKASKTTPFVELIKIKRKKNNNNNFWIGPFWQLSLNKLALIINTISCMPLVIKKPTPTPSRARVEAPLRRSTTFSEIKSVRLWQIGGGQWGVSDNPWRLQVSTPLGVVFGLKCSLLWACFLLQAV